MKAQTKSSVYMFISFATIFLITRFLLGRFTELSWIWLPIISAGIAVFLAPQFKVVQTKDGEKILMRWIFLKGVKTLK